jgi:hypothetical protein
MKTKTLIELVNEAKEQNYRYIAVDKDKIIYAFQQEPYVKGSIWSDKQYSRYRCLGKYNLTCDWKDSLIDLNALTL